VLIQSKRNKHAALKLMRKLLKKYAFVPEWLVTDDLRSYIAAARDLGIKDGHERGRWKNNRAENSHQPTRRRERKMQRFKSPQLRAEFPLEPCRRLQHLQPPTPSHFSPSAQRATR
jgi:transposase-like protein